MSDELKASLIVGGWFVLAVVVVAVIMAKQEYGQLPRGLRWIPGLWQRSKRGTGSVLIRVFYPEVWQERQKERERLALQEKTGMTPWWDEYAQRWRPGDVLEIKNQIGAVISKRPTGYVNYYGLKKLGNLS